MDVVSIIAALKAAVPAADYEAADAVDRPTIIVPREHLPATALAMRDRAGFDVLTDVVGVDVWPAEPRFEVEYHVVATEAPAMARLRVRLSGDDPHVPTLIAVWPSANWLEREVWDLFGVVFDGHPDLRRLLMPEDWEGHPLRKDYPVQITMTPKVYAPLQLTEEEFRAKVVEDRDVRGGGRLER